MLVGTSTKNRVLLDMGEKSHAVRHISGKGRVLFGMSDRSRVLFGMSVKSPVLFFSMFRLRAKQYETFCCTPAKLRSPRHTARDIFAVFGKGLRVPEQIAIGPQYRNQSC